MARLVATVKLAVNREADKADPNEEIFLRSLVDTIRNLTSLVGRGKYEFTHQYDRPDETRRPSVRKPNKKGKHVKR
jgi:hypothetical protein